MTTQKEKQHLSSATKPSLSSHRPSIPSFSNTRTSSALGGATRGTETSLKSSSLANMPPLHTKKNSDTGATQLTERREGLLKNRLATSSIKIDSSAEKRISEQKQTTSNVFSKGREMAATARSMAESSARSDSLTRREFVLSAQDFEAIRHRIYQHAGIVLTQSKQDMVYGRLAKRLRFHRLSSFAEYILLLDKDRAEWDFFVNALTTNLTSFFREPHHFERLAQIFKEGPKGRSYRIWCCAASTGEEPYSLAMTACEAFDTLSPPVRIVATDLNTEVIDEAKKGTYDQGRVSALSATRLKRFFSAVKNTDAKIARWQVNAQLRQMIEFGQLNLLDNRWSVSGYFDAIFCRNVMIYFDRDTQHQILKRFVPLLAPDGELYAGHSESFLYASEIFRNVGKTVYQKSSS